MANNLGVAFSALFSISFKKTSVAATELEKKYQKLVSLLVTFVCLICSILTFYICFWPF